MARDFTIDESMKEYYRRLWEQNPLAQWYPLDMFLSLPDAYKDRLLDPDRSVLVPSLGACIQTLRNVSGTISSRLELLVRYSGRHQCLTPEQAEELQYYWGIIWQFLVNHGIVEHSTPGRIGNA